MANVVTGPRGPHKPVERVDKAAPVAVAEGSIAYGSAVKSYRVQITAPYDIHNPQTGRVTRAEPKVAQFREFTYIASGEDQEIIDELDKIAGVGKKIWRQADLDASIAAAKDNEVRMFVQANPEKVSEMLKEIAGAKDVAALVKDKK